MGILGRCVRVAVGSSCVLLVALPATANDPNGWTELAVPRHRRRSPCSYFVPAFGWQGVALTGRTTSRYATALSHADRASGFGLSVDGGALFMPAQFWLGDHHGLVEPQVLLPYVGWQLGWYPDPDGAWRVGLGSSYLGDAVSLRGVTFHGAVVYSACLGCGVAIRLQARVEGGRLSETLATRLREAAYLAPGFELALGY